MLVSKLLLGGLLFGSCAYSNRIEDDPFRPLQNRVNHGLSKKKISNTLHDSLRQIESLANNIKEEISDVMGSLSDHNFTSPNEDLFDTMAQRMKKEHEAMRERQRSLRTMFNDMGMPIKEVGKPFYIEEKRFKKDGNDIYELHIQLPGFTRDNLMISTETMKHRLNIKGEKELQTSVSRTFEEGGMKGESRYEHKEKVHSSRVIDGREQTIDYKNGTLKVSVDLPDDVDDGTMSVSYHDNGLVLVQYTIKD